MSTEITTAMVDAYNTGVEMLAQQMQSHLIDKVRRESKTGKRNAFDQVGVVAARERTTRHGDTQYVNTPHRRRWVSQKHYEVADLLDVQDLLEILNNPSGEYARAFISAMNRKRDQVILEAALGTAYTGEDGTTATTFDAANLIGAGGTGFTLAKVKTAMRLLKAGNAVDPNNPDTGLYIAWTSYQEEEFMDTTEVKSIDYNTQRVLVKGTMGGADQFYGFNYVRLEDWTDELAATHRIIAKSGTTRKCVAWVKDGLLLNDPMPPRTTVDRMPGKGNAQQILTQSSFGASRMQEPKVIEIDCVEP